MNRKYEIYQYLSLVRYKAVYKFLHNINKKISIILDLEDSAKDIFDIENTYKLKKQCRDGIIYFSKQNKNFLRNINLYIRINSSNSKYFKDDIVCLKKIVKKKIIKGIFLPKVADYNVIQKLNNLLKLKKYNISIVAMIENKKGLLNLEKILKKDIQNNLISKIHYGHYDYCLSERLWPFPEPYHKELWEICGNIIKLCQIYKKQYIQFPFPLINNPNLFNQYIEYMRSKYKNLDFGMSLINYNEKYFKVKKQIKSLKIKSQGKNKKFKLLYARKIYNNYLSSKNKKKSFSLTKKLFIPPHQYMMAKLYLHKNEKKR